MVRLLSCHVQLVVSCRPINHGCDKSYPFPCACSNTFLSFNTSADLFHIECEAEIPVCSSLNSLPWAEHLLPSSPKNTQLYTYHLSKFAFVRPYSLPGRLELFRGPTRSCWEITHRDTIYQDWHTLVLDIPSTISGLESLLGHSTTPPRQERQVSKTRQIQHPYCTI